MPWFPVDDSFYSHPKTLATSLAARGLWVTAGSWSSAHLQDGAVPDHVLASLGGTPELAAELVAAGLWKRTKRGYVFHDWLEWGSKRTAAEIRELRAVRAETDGREGRPAGGAEENESSHATKQEGSKPCTPTVPNLDTATRMSRENGLANAKQTRSNLLRRRFAGA